MTDVTPQKRLKFSPIYVAISILLVTALATTAVLLLTGKHDPKFFSQQQVRSVNFPLYYPSSLPADYSRDGSQTRFENGLCFFVIKNNHSSLSFSEQKLPSPPPDLGALKKINTSFKDVNLDSASAIWGIDPSSQQPVAIVETNTTLISVQATSNTPSDVLVSLVKQLRSL